VLLSRMGARRLGALMAGALVSVSAGLGVGSASAQARRDVYASPQPWTVQKSYPPVIDDVAGLSCPTSSDCWGRGNHALGCRRNCGQHKRRQHLDLRSRSKGLALPSRHFLPHDDQLLGCGL
jgi:hypothetical protein